MPADVSLHRVDSVHRDDPAGTGDGYRSPDVIDEEMADYYEACLDRQREHAPARCWECEQQAAWIAEEEEQ